MTRTEMQRAELTISDRHNREMEKQQEISNVVGAIGAIGSLARGVGSLGKGIRSASDNKVTDRNLRSGDRYHLHKHYYGRKGD